VTLTVTNVRSIRRRATALLVLVLVAGACRGSEKETGEAAATTRASDAGVTTTAAESRGPGDFGDLADVCGPGDATGATARGVTDTAIQITTMGDPGNTIRPGLGQEGFDVANGFAQRCNEAGGILGRKIEVHTRDAKLFEAGARFVEACQTDFMSVGGGNGLDDATVEPRLGCELGQMPSFTASAKATEADLQVLAAPNPLDRYPIGGIRLVSEAVPGTAEHFGLLGRDDANGAATLNRAKDAAAMVGVTVVDVATHPASAVDNWRPYVETWRAKGVEMFTPISWPDISVIVQAMNDVGWQPKAIALTSIGYNDGTIAAAKNSDLPPTWVGLNYWPFELADDNPAVSQLVDLVHSVNPDAKFTNFHVTAMNAWLLWAVSAKACGSDLTVECVLREAKTQSSWTAGGMLPTVDLSVANPEPHSCFVLMRATADGFVYDEEVTQPTDSIYNCDPANEAHLTEDYSVDGG